MSKEWEKELKYSPAAIDDGDDWHLSLFEAFIKFHSFVMRKREGNPSYMSDQVLEALEDMVEVVSEYIERIKKREFIEEEHLQDLHDDIRSFLHKYALTYKFREFWDEGFEGPTGTTLATDEPLLIDEPESDEFDPDWQHLRRSENKPNDSWWTTLKEGGPITSAKAGITNMAYGKGAQKPKKKKKFKPKKEKDLEPKMPPKPVKPEKSQKVIPDEPDFWRD